MAKVMVVGGIFLGPDRVRALGRAGVGMLVAVAGLAMPTRGAAQRVEVPGAPWGASRATVIAGIERLGFRAEQDTAAGPRFETVAFHSDAATLAAIFGSNGLAMLNQLHVLPPDQAHRRFGELRDSLVRLLGEPDSAGGAPVWVRPDGHVRLFVRPDSAGLSSAAILNRASPTYLAEMRAAYRRLVRDDRRQLRWVAARVDSARWRALAVKDSVALTFDRGSVEKQPSGAWRLTVRWDWLVPQRGGGMRYDAMVEQTEIRCDEGTYRRGRTEWFLGERSAGTPASRWGGWSRPVPTSGGGVIVRELCDYARELP